VTRAWAAATRLQIFFKLFQHLVDALAVGVSDTAIAPDNFSRKTLEHVVTEKISSYDRKL